MQSRNSLRHRLGMATLGVSLVVGATAGVQVVGTEAASAHTGDLRVTAVCNQQTGQQDFTAKLILSSVPSGNTGSTKWRIGTSSFDGTPSNANGMDKGPISSNGNVTITLGTWSLPGTTTGYGPWVYAYTKWSPDGYGKGSDGQLTSKLKGDCKPAVVKDASASVSTTPATCTTPEKLVLGQAIKATWGTPTRTTGPGSYSVTATANQGHAFSDGSPTKPFTGNLADKLDPNTVPDCRPTPPQPKVVHKTDDKMDCSGVFHREWDLSYPPVWDKTTRAWVWGQPVVKNDSGWVKVRDLTPAEKASHNCTKPDRPRPVVEPLSEVRKSCEYGVEHRAGTRTTDWVFDENTWQWVASAPIVQWNGWVFDRGLTATEQQQLGCIQVSPPPGPVPVRGAVKKLDKCGSNNFVYVKKREGLRAMMKGKVIREGVWIKVKAKKVRIRMIAEPGYNLVGKKNFLIKFPNNKPCHASPHNSPHTGV